jgi:hypothetical protein
MDKLKMSMSTRRRPVSHNLLAQRFATVFVVLLGFSGAAAAQTFFVPGNVVISRSVYDNNPNNVAVGQLLPPDCQSTTVGCNGNAIANGTYPYVWNNDTQRLWHYC